MKDGSIRFLAMLFCLSALLFTEATTSLTMGLITVIGYLVFYKRNKKAILLVISCALSFALFEGVGRSIVSKHIELVYDTENDHRMKPYWKPGINGDGIRSRAESDDFTEDTFNIICLGDSFTYGELIEETDDTLPGQLEVLANELNPATRIRTANFGWVSSSPRLSCRLLQDIGRKYKPDLVMLFVDITDFHDDLKYRYEDNPIGNSPSVMLLHRVGLLDHYLQLRERWRVHRLFRQVFKIAVLVPEDRFFIVNQPLEDSLPRLEEIQTNIEKINAYCTTDLKVPFIMVLLPRYIHYNRQECPRNWERGLYTPFGPHVFAPFEWLEEYGEQSAFPCYSLLTTFQQTSVFPTCFQDDPHWNPAGCRVAAKGVLNVLQQEGLVGGPTSDPQPRGAIAAP